MEWFPLPIFPYGGLASSVVTTVWVGVAVVAFFNLRFGWVLSGLVVPGYLVPLLLLKPWAAVVVIGEGIITYLLVWLFSEVLSRWGYWTSFFGRDRFFALVLMSVLVRVVMDGWLLPELGAWLVAHYDSTFDYRSNLHSFGLIIVALVANQFWKTGLLRGLPPLLTTLAITYVIVRYGLMTATNFTLSNIGYMYEDVAESILASPKAYIILLTAALIASRMNLLYGWEFSGILIPSLLALQWYQPGKILASFAEAFIILLTARGLLRLPMFRDANIEGARQLLFFFNIGFVYKLLLAYAVLWFFPTMKITDSYAFGYLLATLLALKMHDKDIPGRMTRATLQVSLVGVAGASVVGFALTLLPLGPSFEGGAYAARATPVESVSTPLGERLSQDKVRSFAASQSLAMAVPLVSELERFAAALSALDLYRQQADDTALQQATGLLDSLGYQVLRVQQRYLYLVERPPGRGWGSYVLDLEQPLGVVVEIPAPFDEPGVLEAGVQLFHATGASALAIAGSRRGLSPDRSSDVLATGQTLFQRFHREVARRGAVQVRGYTPSMTRELSGLRAETHIDEEQLPNHMWVTRDLPADLPLGAIRGLVGEMELTWGASPFVNRQRDEARGGFVELLLSRPALRSVRAKGYARDSEEQVAVQEQRIDGYLQEWILSGKQQIAAGGSDLYVPATLDELLYFDEEILTPLLRSMQRDYRDGDWTEIGLSELRSIEAAASAVGYQLLRYRHRSTRQDYVVLYEPEQAPRRYWGTYVFRLGETHPYIVQVPRPLYEVNSFEYAVALFERLGAGALLIAGAHPDANADGSADVVRLANLQSVFSLVGQVLMREAGAEPQMVIHSRARAFRDVTDEEAQADVLLSVRSDLELAFGEDPLSTALIQTLEQDGLSMSFVTGSPATAGYEVGGVPQSLYLEASTNKIFCVAWLSPLARAGYRQQSENRQEIGRFAALGINSEETDLPQLAAGLMQKRSGPLNAGLVLDVRRYLLSQDIVSLRRLQQTWPDYQLQRLVDRDSRQSFLYVQHQHKPIALFNLNPRDVEEHIAVDGQGDSDASVLIRRFIDRRAGMLAFGDAP